MGEGIHFNAQFIQFTQESHEAAAYLITCWLDVQDVAARVHICEEAMVDIVHEAWTINYDVLLVGAWERGIIV